MRAVFIAFSLLLATATTACNTIEGFGKDLKAVGHALSDAADDAKN